PLFPYTTLFRSGFTEIDLFTSHIRISELDDVGRQSLLRTLGEAALRISAVQLARRSIIDADPDRAAANLQFAIDTVRAAGELGVGMVCLGLHQPLTQAQQEAHWFWLAQGEEDPDDPAVWAAAGDGVRRVGEEAGGGGVGICQSW